MDMANIHGMESRGLLQVPAFVRFVGAPGARVVCVYYVFVAFVDKLILL